MGGVSFGLRSRTLAAADKPNVLFVFSDMQRAYSMGCYGDANARTPHLDALARQGARFDAAISNTPVCCPYRACLMSGQYAHHNGVMSNGVPFRPTVKCVAETFRDAGYETGYSGKWHISTPREMGEELRYGFPESGTPFGFYRTDRHRPTSPTWRSSSSPRRARGRNPGCCSSPGSCPTRRTRRRTGIASISQRSRSRPTFRRARPRRTPGSACPTTTA